MTATFNTRLFNIAAYVTVPALTVVSWFILYLTTTSSLPPHSEGDSLSVTIMTTAFLLLLPTVTAGIAGAGLSLFLTSVRSQKWLAGFAFTFNIILIFLYYGVLTAASIIPSCGMPRTELNFLSFLVGGLLSLFYAGYLCFKIWAENVPQEENIWGRKNSLLDATREDTPV